MHLSSPSHYGHSRHLKSKNKRSFGKFVLSVVVIAVILAVPAYAYEHAKANNHPSKNSTSSKSLTGTIATKTIKTAPAVTTQTTACTTNTVKQIIIASISARHLWVCDGSQVLYQTAVITGDMNVVADVTPVGTYSIYAKETDVHLIGSDSRGSWDDFVYYWMPFLDDQYGVFGLHDATWRAPTDFGSISPYSDNASHGCIELPLAAAKWIYDWSSIGTTVTIES